VPIAHLLVDISRSTDGRLEGTIRNGDEGDLTPFSGTLELLKVLEGKIEPPSWDETGREQP
jgi:hypothetical protein